MAEESGLIAFEYLVSGSKTSLQNSLMNRLADVSNRRKEIIELLDKWAERQAEATLLAWFLEHGEELMAALAASPVTEIQPASLPRKPGPMKAIDFRDRLKNILESA